LKILNMKKKKKKAINSFPEAGESSQIVSSLS